MPTKIIANVLTRDRPIYQPTDILPFEDQPICEFKLMIRNAHYYHPILDFKYRFQKLYRSVSSSNLVLCHIVIKYLLQKLLLSLVKLRLCSLYFQFLILFWEWSMKFQSLALMIQHT